MKRRVVYECTACKGRTCRVVQVSADGSVCRDCVARMRRISVCDIPECNDIEQTEERSHCKQMEDENESNS